MLRYIGTCRVTDGWGGNLKITYSGFFYKISHTILIDYNIFLFTNLIFLHFVITIDYFHFWSEITYIIVFVNVFTWYKYWESLD